LLAEVGSESVKLHLDTFHMNIEEDSIGGAIITAGSQIGHLHCVANNRKAPGRGHINWKEVRAAVKAVNYRGYVVGEVFVNPTGEVGRGMAIWRELAPDLMATAKETAQFLKKEVANVDE
jgi:D-psicose/D-tagatose/L-ribulose 3-epimerase